VTCPITNRESFFANKLFAPISFASTIPAMSDENQKDVINRRNGQKSKHLKFFLLVFSKDKAQAQEAQAQPMRSKAKH